MTVVSYQLSVVSCQLFFLLISLISLIFPSPQSPVLTGVGFLLVFQKPWFGV
ncbi:hypothetical protein [Anabaena azotica]|uniref:Uncharacterized protein n=1 Tax=Anabaena azotica FACHB-119 TaxID=947527 RepID=A0ABR8D690_9NOST|nr:hypothetical protein [Anabaena azotica]MBD2501958.1 hypothetical protein [Anabaena azotica FACHB-119]